MTWIVQGFPHPSSAICPDRQALNLPQAPTVERDGAPTHQTTKANKNGQTLVLLYCQRKTASPLYTLNWKRCPLNLFSNDVYVYFHIYIYMVVNTYTKSQFPSEYNNAPGKYKVFPQSLTAADMKGETMIQKEKCILNNYVKTKIGIFYC